MAPHDSQRQQSGQGTHYRWLSYDVGLSRNQVAITVRTSIGLVASQCTFPVRARVALCAERDEVQLRIIPGVASKL